MRQRIPISPLASHASHSFLLSSRLSINGIAGVYPGHFNLGDIEQEEFIRKSLKAVYSDGRNKMGHL